jgi:hypothetical protein
MNIINPKHLTSIRPITPLLNLVSTHIVKLAVAVLLRNPLRRLARPCNLDGNPVLVRSSACEVARHNLPLYNCQLQNPVCSRSHVEGGYYQVLVAAKLVDGI